jgi:glycine dehydrogenase subunit 1
MDFVSNQDVQIKEMLRSIGVDSIEALFTSIPPSLFHNKPLNDDGLSEAESLTLFEQIGKENTFSQFDSYLGGGAYQHYIPALVGAITSRSEFLTAYTPYQAEISQGLLQVTFEFQSAIAALTGLDAANASVYDGASACAEAVLMALRVHKDRKCIAVSSGLNPLYKAVIEQYLAGFEIEIVPLEKSKDRTDIACVIAQSPNFFGVIEDMPGLTTEAHAKGALFIACGNPLAYGLLIPPGEYGADIAVGDCQPLGLNLNFGGPYAGYMACKSELIRQLPGRIVGQTVDSKGQKGFVLTLQAREQHIRREKATSNICTNQALAALAALVTMLWYGPVGLNKLALTNYSRAHYLSCVLENLPGFSVLHSHFNEFTLKLPCKVEIAEAHFRKHNIEPGIALNRFYPEMDQHLLVAVTELKSLEQLKKYAIVAGKL